jgi:hypothetical protein
MFGHGWFTPAGSPDVGFQGKEEMEGPRSGHLLTVREEGIEIGSLRTLFENTFIWCRICRTRVQQMQDSSARIAERMRPRNLVVQDLQDSLPGAIGF